MALIYGTHEYDKAVRATARRMDDALDLLHAITGLSRAEVACIAGADDGSQFEDKLFTAVRHARLGRDLADE